MGYIGQSRSERSQQAINEGLLIKNQLKAWQKRAVEQGVVRASEWHHTGKYFNKTNYYDPDDFKQLNPKDFSPIKTNTVKEDETWYVLVSAEWGGTKKHPKIVGENVVVTNKVTTRQKSANKYQLYGGYIKTFNNETEANEFAKTATLN